MLLVTEKLVLLCFRFNDWRN